MMVIVTTLHIAQQPYASDSGTTEVLARRSTYRSDWNLGKNNDGPELERFPTIWLIFSGI